MKALITGVSGFVGPYLVRHLVSNGFEVFGIDRSSSRLEGCRVFRCDITDAGATAAVVREVQPDFVFHLAGQSSVELSWKKPGLTREVNVGGTRSLLDAVAAARLNPKILVVSSAEVYGVPAKLPVDEQHPLAPVSPYGRSRVEQERLALERFSKNRAQVVISRSFSHTGPGQASAFVCSNFAMQLAKAESGGTSEVLVGNLESKRDFIDVRDVVRAYLLALQRCKAGEAYNICSGRSYSVRWVLDTLISFSGASGSLKIVRDASRMRESDVPELLGSNSKFAATTGWKPEIPFEKTLQEMLDYWRKSI